jgi:hypothetical protein
LADAAITRTSVGQNRIFRRCSSSGARRPARQSESKAKDEIGDHGLESKDHNNKRGEYCSDARSIAENGLTPKSIPDFRNLFKWFVGHGRGLEMGRKNNTSRASIRRIAVAGARWSKS